VQSAELGMQSLYPLPSTLYYPLPFNT